MMQGLGELKVGDRGKIVGFAGGSAVYRQRLLAMGLTPGVEFFVKRVAPLGDPIELHLRGYPLSLRKNESQSLLVERIE